MGTSLVDILVATSTIVMPLVTLLGFVFIYQQIRITSTSVQSQATSELYALAMRIYEMVIANPEMCAYLYEGKETPTDKTERARVFVACEMICDFYEYILTQEKAIDKTICLLWISAIRTAFRRSPAMRQFIHERRNEYTDEFLKIFEESRDPDSLTPA